MSSRRTATPSRGRTFAPGGKGDRRRREILDEAARLFSKNGYANTSLEDIALANGISKSALYHYFRSRDEILFEMHQVLADDFNDHASVLRGSGMSPEELLRASVEKIVVANETIPGYVQAFFEHYRELPTRFRKIAKARSEEYRDFIESIVRDGIAAGDFRPFPVEITTLAIFGMCNWANKWFSKSGPMTGAQIAAVMADILINGLKVGELHPNALSEEISTSSMAT